LFKYSIQKVIQTSLRPVNVIPTSGTVVYPVNLQSQYNQPPQYPYNTTVYSTTTTTEYPHQQNVYPPVNNYPPNYNNQFNNPNTMNNAIY
jgi:hypothetical protein